MDMTGATYFAGNRPYPLVLLRQFVLIGLCTIEIPSMKTHGEKWRRDVIHLETINWEREAEWVGWAFGLVGGCVFRKGDDGNHREGEGRRHESTARTLYGPKGDDSIRFADGNDFVFTCYYLKDGSRCFYITTYPYDDEDEDLEEEGVIVQPFMMPPVTSIVHIMADGEAMVAVRDKGHAAIFATGLGRLGCFTSEIEAALEIPITYHQKLEWALEYEAQIKSDRRL